MSDGYSDVVGLFQTWMTCSSDDDNSEASDSEDDEALAQLLEGAPTAGGVVSHGGFQERNPRLAYSFDLSSLCLCSGMWICCM